MIRGASIEVNQRSTDPAVTGDVMGIEFGGNAGSEFEAMDCIIEVTNAGTGAAYALGTARTLYRSNIYSKQSNAPGGTYLAMPTV